MAGATDLGCGDDRRIGDQSEGGCGPGKRGNDEDGSPTPVEVSCSICLELVLDDGTRSKAKLQCGHLFHLDCIGSAFNMKGAMQCPNCRNVEKGQWLYANGSTRPLPDFSFEDWIPEEDLYGLTYPEMQYRVHWCPFGELAQAGSFEELEPATTTTYHNDFHGHHAAAVNHSYLAYVGPGPRTSENNNNTDDHPSWISHPNDHFHQLAVAPQYHHHHHSPSFSLPGAHVVDGENDSSAARGISYPHPFLFSHRSNQRTSPSPAINSHQGSSNQMREHLHTQHHHVFNHPRQHHANGPTLASPLISVSRRGGLPAPPPPMQDQNVGFFVYPPPGGHLEPETDQFHGWERDWFPHFPVPSNHRAISSLWPRHY
ncbi:PREDICTED: uncharacterized protein LOC104783362 [Camelina sativa]|uniref:Uncharacterized protein LOC104783362 n=1 Tax=Camelina sativa TaxID=90675 RepID=A0ABM0YWB5_CAMSA|nr:PREDICTED: uncharacterized protein LOC104783362 [Camelina sativa]